MDADGLPIVGPGIDYTKVEAINQKRLIAFVNHFVSHTAGFLNRFSCVCEEKLERLSHRMQQLEITMNLLDAKIGSIPGLENVTAPTSAASGGATNTAQSTTPDHPPTETSPAVPTPAAPAEPDTAAPAPPAPEVEEPTQNPVSKDPRYMKFFKMLQYGVPTPSVKAKMGLEGLNQDLLDTPDAPAPAGGAPQKDDDDDDFSSDSNQQSEDSDSDFDD